MSDQPKPTATEQVQDYLKKWPIPKPTASGEWTQVKLLEMYLADDSFKSIADAINAALDKVVADDAEIIVELEAALAAEREKYLHEARAWFDRDKQLREQIDKQEHKKFAYDSDHSLPDFRGTYELLARDGKCDLPDGVEYERVFREWCDQGCPSNVETFITIRANAKQESSNNK